MKKNSLLLILVFISPFLFSQDLTLLELKKPIEEKDHAILMRYLSTCFEPTANIEFSFSNVGLQKNPPEKPEKIITEKDFIAIKLKIKESPDNIDYNIIAGNYAKTLNHPKEAERYLRKAIDLIAKASKENPNDAGLYQKAGIAYTALGEHQMVIMSYEKALKLDPERDTISNGLLPMSYLNIGYFIKLKEHCEGLLQKYPDDLYAHLMYCFGSLYQRMVTGFDYGTNSPQQFFENYSIYKDVDTSHLRKSILNYPDDISYQGLLHGIELYGLLLEVYTTYDNLNNKIILTNKSKKVLEENKKFFTDIIRKKKTNNYYFPYLSLGLISMMENNHKEALNYMDKAIKSFSKNAFSAQFNTGSAYETKIYLHLISGDTLSAEKVLNEKIDLKPIGYLSPGDVFKKVCFRIYKNDFDEAEKTLKTIPSIDSNFTESKLAEAFFHIHKKEYAKAQVILEEQYTFMKTDYRYNFIYGILLLLKGESNTAKVFFSKVISIAPDDKVIVRLIDQYYKNP